MIIREVQSHEFELVQQIATTAFPDRTFSKTEFQHVMTHPLDAIFVCLDTHDSPLGITVVYTMPPIARLLWVGVDPHHRRQGIGTQLIQTAESWTQQYGVTTLELFVFTTDQPAIDFYRALHFDSRHTFLFYTLPIDLPKTPDTFDTRYVTCRYHTLSEHTQQQLSHISGMHPGVLKYYEHNSELYTLTIRNNNTQNISFGCLQIEFPVIFPLIVTDVHDLPVLIHRLSKYYSDTQQPCPSHITVGFRADSILAQYCQDNQYPFVMKTMLFQRQIK